MEPIKTRRLVSALAGGAVRTSGRIASTVLSEFAILQPVTKREVSDAIQAAMRQKGLTFAELAAELDRPRVWLAAAVLGQHPFPRDAAEKLAATLELPEDAVVALEQIPTRGGLDAAVPVDPTIYRLYEVIQVYGPALKALLHEEFGDGIMSAINFRADIERVPDPAGDRVRITFDGKFLPYQWD